MTKKGQRALGNFRKERKNVFSIIEHYKYLFKKKKKNEKMLKKLPKDSNIQKFVFDFELEWKFNILKALSALRNIFSS